MHFVINLCNDDFVPWRNLLIVVNVITINVMKFKYPFFIAEGIDMLTISRC